MAAAVEPRARAPLERGTHGDRDALFTTLAPALLHIWAVLYGVFAVWSLGIRLVASLIPVAPLADMPPSAKKEVAWHLLRQKLWLLPAILCPLVLLMVLVTAARYWIAPIGLFLADLALYATSWPYGLCPWTG